MKKSLTFFVSALAFLLVLSCKHNVEQPQKITQTSSIIFGKKQSDGKIVFNDYSSAKNYYLAKINTTSETIKGTTKISSSEIDEEYTLVSSDFIDEENEKNMHLNLDFVSDNSRSAGSGERVINDNVAAVGAKRTVYVLDNNHKNQPCEAVCKAVGKKCNVWFINNAPNVVTESALDNINAFQKYAEKFDFIREAEEEILGESYYNSKVIYSKYNNVSVQFYADPVKNIDIFVADLYFDATTSQNSGVAGYFYSLDLFNPIFYSTSNATQCIYMDSLFTLKILNKMYSTLVHEYNHLLNFCNKAITANVNNRLNNNKTNVSYST